MSTTEEDTNIMSIAILPSTPATSHIHAPLHTAMTSPAKRPKLSLDTSTSTSTFIGKHSTSLRLETLSATSPTIRNTFGNAYATTKKPALTSLATTGLNKRPYVATPVQTNDDDEENTPVSATASPIKSFKSSIPYNIGFHIKSILRNGPIQRSRSRPNQSSPLSPTFSLAKKVLFRAPLTEEVKNEKYIWANSDIEPPTPTLPTESPVESKQEVGAGQDDGQLLQPKVYSAPRRKISQDSESDICPATPIAGRRKKDRQWQWTLGSLDSASAQSEKQNVTADSPNLLAIDAR